MLNGLLYAHSGLRYLVLLSGVVALGYALFSVLTSRSYDQGMRRTAAAFAGLLHFQILVGFVFLVSGRFYPALIGHIVMMLGAATAAQVPLSVLRRRAPEDRRPMPHLIGTVIALAMIWGGIVSIGRGFLGNSF
jgi:heme A synthase